MKIRVIIDTNDCSFDSMNENSYTNGVVGITIDGVGRWFYGSFNEFVPFNNVEVLECNHECGKEKGTDKCYDCEQDLSEVIEV